MAEPLTDGKKTSRGWLDKESGAFYMRSEEAAKGLAGMVMGDEAGIGQKFVEARDEGVRYRFAVDREDFD
ncbi:MAG: hypothetical protein HDR94_02425 [Bacteroides sp.]|nr:hypothetical protein [Bacteroides sp.]